MQSLSDTAYSAYPHLKNQTVKWLPGDHENRWKENQKDPDKSKLLIELGFTHDNVEYKFNSAGFRSDEFSEGKSILFLGCSHVTGIGLNFEDTMAYQVAKSLGFKCYNLAVGAGSIDSCFRYALHWIPKIKPNIVVQIQPDPVRLECFFHVEKPNKEKSFTHLLRLPFEIEKYPHMVDFYEGWTGADINMELHAVKNTLAIRQICNDNKVKFVNFLWSDVFKCNPKINLLHDPDVFKNNPKIDLARDLAHFGVETNKLAADKVLAGINNGNLK